MYKIATYISAPTSFVASPRPCRPSLLINFSNCCHGATFMSFIWDSRSQTAILAPQPPSHRSLTQSVHQRHAFFPDDDTSRASQFGIRLRGDPLSPFRSFLSLLLTAPRPPPSERPPALAASVSLPRPCVGPLTREHSGLVVEAHSTIVSAEHQGQMIYFIPF